MIADRPRMDAYHQALGQAIKPGSVVLDIGAGTGILSLLACRLGAERVYAIEPGDAIQVAKEIAAANNYAGRIQFIQSLSTQVTLPERADVIVSDLRGVLPLFSNHIPSIIDARQRLLAPSGVLIPQRDTLWAAVVEAPDLYNPLTQPWDDNVYGFDMRAARRKATNTWIKARVEPEQLLTEPQQWATLDYQTIESTHVNCEITWTLRRAGTAHGLVLWFASVLQAGVHMTCAPGGPELVYGNAFFPWTSPVTLEAGDSVSIGLRADLVGDEYIWSWATRALAQGQPENIKAAYKQSTFWGAPLSQANLHKRGAGFIPELNEQAQVDRFILSLMDGETSSGDIARQCLSRFPSRFATLQDALTRVGDMALKYSR